MLRASVTCLQAVVLLVFVASASPGQTVAAWDLDGTINSGPPRLPAFSHSRVTAGSLTRSSPLFPFTSLHGFQAQNWPTGGAPDLSRYFEFSITADPGWEVTYQQVRFTLYGEFGGISSWQIRSSVNGFAGVLDNGFIAFAAIPGTPVAATVSGAGIRQGTVTFRVYVYGNGGNINPTIRGFRGQAGGGQDLRVTGFVDPVVMPPSYPGTGEDLETRYAIGGGATTTVTDDSNDRTNASPGQLVVVGHESPSATFDGVGELVVLGSFGPYAAAPITIIPGLHLGATSVFLVTPAPAPGLGPVQMVPGGFNYGFTHPGGALSNLNLFLQAVVLHASAANGTYASTHLLEVRLD